MLAFKTQDINFLEYILEKNENIDINIINDAIKSNNIDIIDMILLNNVNFDILKYINYNTILNAIKINNILILNRILELLDEETLNLLNKNLNYEYIQESIKTNNLNIVNKILELEIKINKLDFNIIIELIIKNDKLFYNKENNNKLLKLINGKCNNEFIDKLKNKMIIILKYYNKYYKYKKKYLLIKV
jgi:hypothetical protein